MSLVSKALAMVEKAVASANASRPSDVFEDIRGIIDATNVSNVIGTGIYGGKKKIEYTLLSSFTSEFTTAGGKTCYKVNHIGGCNLPVFLPLAEGEEFIRRNQLDRTPTPEDCVVVKFNKTMDVQGVSTVETGVTVMPAIAFPLWIRANAAAMTDALKKDLKSLTLDGKTFDVTSIPNKEAAVKAAGGWLLSKVFVEDCTTELWDKLTAQAESLSKAETAKV